MSTITKPKNRVIRNGSPAAVYELGRANATSGGFTSGSTSFVTPTGCIAVLKTTGGAVVAELQPDGGGVAANIGANGAFFVRLLRDGVQVALTELNTALAPPSILRFIDYNPPAGFHTYEMQFRSSAGGVTYAVSDCVLFVYEF